MTPTSDDPTVRSRGGLPEYPEGTHPPVSPDEQTWGPGRFSYSDLDDAQKPDKSTVASEVEDPLGDEVEEAKREQAESSASKSKSK